MDRIEHLPRVQDDPIVEALRAYAGATTWIYTRSTIYPFHAGLPVIPELAVLPLNRSWSGRVTHRQIYEIIVKYAPEQLLISEELEPRARAYVDANYELVWRDASHRLYVATEVLNRLRCPSTSG